MSDGHGHELDQPVGEGRRRGKRRLLLAAAVVVSALLGGGLAALFTGPDARTPTAASPGPTSPAATPSADPPAASPAPPDPSPAPPSPSPTAAVPELIDVAEDEASFRTPSDNIGCSMTATSATCDLRERSWEPPPRPADCELDYGQGTFVDDTGSGLTCAGDTPFVPDSSVLEYGTGWVLGDVRCVSARDGVTCENTATGHGFAVSRDRYRLF